MAYVIAEPCIGTKDTACVDVCPVDCIHPRKDEAGHEAVTQLYINPVECIDCGACVPVCPVTAIFRDGRFAGKVAGVCGGKHRLVREEVGKEIFVRQSCGAQFLELGAFFFAGKVRS